MQKFADSKRSRLSTLHHVALPVNDIAEAVNWYRERFQCEVAHQDATWAFLRFANTSLALVLPEQHPGHVAFLVELAGRTDVGEHRDGTRYVYESDPWGNTVEHLELPEPGKVSPSPGD